jgi:hypothetical protein
LKNAIVPRLAQRILRPRQHQADEIIQRARPQQEEEESPIPGGVEEIAAEEQPDLARPVIAQTPVDAEDREKEPEEAKFYEEHAELSFFSIIESGFRDEAAKNSQLQAW